MPVDGVEPMKLLELARIWIHPSLQNLYFEDRNGKKHSLFVVSCAVGKLLIKRHEGTIYKVSNFKMTGKSGGNTHGSGKRKDSG